MNRYLIILLFLFFNSLFTFSQNENEVEISLAGKKKSFIPGKIQTLVYRIKNNSEQTLHFHPDIIIPDQWKLITGLGDLSLKPNEFKIQIISINIPSQFLVGKQQIRFLLNDKSDEGKTLFSFETEVYIEEVTNFSVNLVDAPPNTMAGDDTEASFVIRNDGNSEQTYTLSSTNCTIKGQGKITLPPSGSSTVKVNIETSGDLQSVETMGYTLKAKSNGGEEKQAYKRIQVLPKSQESHDLFHRFPVNISTRVLSKSANDQNSTGYQVEISGKGSIDPEGTHQIEFLARGPNQFDVSHLGLYDQYYISYNNNRMKITLGDKSYSLSPLTEQARYGTGIEAVYGVNPTTSVGFFYVKPKFFNEIDNEYALFAKKEFSTENYLQLNLLRKNMPSGEENVNIFSATGNVKLFDKTQAAIELARGFEGGKSDNAFRLTLSSQISKFSLSSFYFYTGEDFPGYYTNSTFYSGFLNYQVFKTMSVSFNARRDFSNAQLDTLFSTAPYSRSLQAGINLKLGSKTFLKSTIRANEREDRLLTKKFHYETLSYNSNITHNAGNFNFRLGGGYGKTTNFLLDENNEKNTFNTNLNLSYKPGEKYSFQVHGSYSNVNSFISDQQNDFIFGVNALANPVKNLNINLHLQNSYSIEEYYRNRNLLQFMIDYEFLKKHKVSLNSYYTIFRKQVEDPEMTVTFNYSYKLGIPLKQVAEAGSVTGKITRENGKSSKGIIVYLNGLSCISDKEGNFFFKNIKPGTYNMLLDRSILSMDEIVDKITPLSVEVIGNQDSKINLAITSAVNLSGKFAIKKAQITTKLLEGDDISLGQIVMELHRENESYRIISNPDGSFQFPFVRPGKWFLKIFRSGMDKQYNFEKDHFEFDFKPGETKELVVKVIKKKRRIIFMNNSINLSSGGDKE